MSSRGFLLRMHDDDSLDQPVARALSPSILSPGIVSPSIIVTRNDYFSAKGGETFLSDKKHRKDYILSLCRHLWVNQQALFLRPFVCVPILFRLCLKIINRWTNKHESAINVCEWLPIDLLILQANGARDLLRCLMFRICLNRLDVVVMETYFDSYVDFVIANGFVAFLNKQIILFFLLSVIYVAWFISCLRFRKYYENSSTRKKKPQESLSLNCRFLICGQEVSIMSNLSLGHDRLLNTLLNSHKLPSLMQIINVLFASLRLRQ